MVIASCQWIRNFHTSRHINKNNNNHTSDPVTSTTVKVFHRLVLFSAIVAISGAGAQQQQQRHLLNFAGGEFPLNGNAKFIASVPSEFLSDPVQDQQQQQLAAMSSPSGVSAVDSGGCPAPCACLGDYFECKKQNLQRVPALPQWVRNLELTGNKLDDSVEDSIGILPFLISLNLKKNHLTRMPQFKGLVALEKLNLAHNRIQAISQKSLQLLPELRELDLMKNRIKTIGVDAFPNPNKINLLNLNGNQIESITAGALDALGKLIELHLGHNQLRDLPNELFKSLNVVKKLDLSHNRLNITWTSFKGLEQLRVLKLRSNGIEHLPDGVFAPLRSVAVIELDTNRLTNLSRSGFFSLNTLTTLSLSNNTIAKLEPDTWEFMQQLVALDLSFNNLSGIARNNFKCLGKLKKLHLQYNSIRYIDDGSFACLANIEYLDMSGNRLSATIEGTPAPFATLKKLQTLELKFNDVKSINKKAFAGLEALVSLNLNGNNITTIQLNAFEPLKRLQRLVLNSSHFLCDCSLQWLYGWLSERRMVDDAALQQQHIDGGEQNDLVLVCDYPPEVRGRPLMTLRRDEDFMCNESPKPRLIKEPSNQLAIKGTNVTLECTAISSKPETMSFQWRRDNFDLKDSNNETETRVVQEMNNNTIVSSFLHLIDMNREHNGKYQCIVSNNFGSAYSQRFKITVSSYPGFRRTPTNVTLKAGNTARLDCSAYGEPMPQIAWQKDGGNDFPAARERRMHVMPTDDAFFIINAKPTDMGVYTCTAENPAGVIKANATLTVHEIPAFIKASDFHYEIVKGKSFVVDCFVQGSPWPEINWYKDDEPVSWKHPPERYYFAADGQLLIVTQADDYIDAGVYKCKIKNELGAAVRAVTVKAAKIVRTAMVNSDVMTGIIIITIFCCTITTSIIWLLIICHTKKGNECNNNNNSIGNGIGTHLTQSLNLQARFRLQQQNQTSVSADTLSAETAFHNGGGRLGGNNSEPINSNRGNGLDGGSGDAMKRYRSIDAELTGQQQQIMPLIETTTTKPHLQPLTTTTTTFQSWPSPNKRSPPAPAPPADNNSQDHLLNNVRRTTSLHNSMENNSRNSPIPSTSCPIEQTLPLIKNSDSSNSSTSIRKIGLTNNSRDTTNNSIHSTVNLSKTSCSNLMNNSGNATATSIPEHRAQV